MFLALYSCIRASAYFWAFFFERLPMTWHSSFRSKWAPGNEEGGFYEHHAVSFPLFILRLLRFRV